MDNPEKLNPIESIMKAMKKITDRNLTVKRTDLPPKRRGRVYCYELYHQMRLLNEFGDFTIHGEIDKRGDHSFNRSNPDFVIHHPGRNQREDNFVTIEVKVSDDLFGIIVDLEKLAYMITKHNYQYGVFILVGTSMDWLKNNGKEAIQHLSKSSNALHQIYIICHLDQHNIEAERLDNLQKETLL